MQLTMAVGASVAEGAREYGLNANQVFKWRRAFERGELEDGQPALLPVAVSAFQPRLSLRTRCRIWLLTSSCMVVARSTSSFPGVR